MLKQYEGKCPSRCEDGDLVFEKFESDGIIELRAPCPDCSGQGRILFEMDTITGYASIQGIRLTNDNNVMELVSDMIEDGSLTQEQGYEIISILRERVQEV